MAVGLLGMPSIAVATTAVTAEGWKAHLLDDLLPFWSETTSAGSGSFPGRLCNDGALPTPGVACPGVTISQANNPSQTLVGQSRQVYSYAVAFHMTGDTTYLDLARKGAAYQFDTFFDATSGLFFENYNQTTHATSPVVSARTSIKQAYGLLGPTMLYHLTGDADLLTRITSVEDAISDRFLDTTTGAFSQNPDLGNPSPNLADHLDQLNAYKTMLAEFAPSPGNARLLTEARQTAAYIRDTFHDPATGIVRTSVSDPSGTLANADLGLSIKAYWFMDQIALMSHDRDLSTFARTEAKRVFEAGFRDDIGAWVTGFDADGNPKSVAGWWQFAELNQFLGALAEGDADMEEMLARTQAFWLKHFVDETNGGIFAGVELDTGLAEANRPKHWEWMAGFHSYEHALVNYLSASARQDTEAELYFARTLPVSAFDLSYGFEGIGSVQLFDASQGNPAYQKLTYSDVRYGSVPAVPLPATLWLLSAGLAGLVRTSARRTEALG